jgi:heterotetrameric sarcosine oxidase gamma subunit
MPRFAPPIARSPLIDLHQRNGAQVARRGDWLVAVKYPDEPATIGNAIVDLAHRPTIEINGHDVGARLTDLTEGDLPNRTIRSADEWHAYRLTPNRAIVFGKLPKPVPDALDVTGGWVSLALLGPHAESLLSKVTAVDLRERTLPVGGCCQGPIFGVNTLFGRFARRFELHVCCDSVEFLWEVLLDAGAEFNLKPVGLDYAERYFV